MYHSVSIVLRLKTPGTASGRQYTGYLQGVAGGPNLEDLVNKMKKIYKSHWKVGVEE